MIKLYSGMRATTKDSEFELDLVLKLPISHWPSDTISSTTVNKK